MATYQIEATIEKLEQGGIQLKGVGKYAFEMSNEKKKDEAKEYWNILEVLPITYSTSPIVEPKKPYPLAKEFQPNFLFSNMLGHAFIERKKLKFELNDQKEITAISQPHAS